MTNIKESLPAQDDKLGKAEENVSQNTSLDDLTSIVDDAKELLDKAESVVKEDVVALKNKFNKILKAEQERIRGDEERESVEQFLLSKETEMKECLAKLREMNKLSQEDEKKKRELNYQIRLSIIEEIRELIDSTDFKGNMYDEFKKMQKQWDEASDIPEGKSKELWQNYQKEVERFYDQLKLNHEFRDYDFKKNLEIKTKLCEAAEKLIDEYDEVSAFHQLQKLHQEFRETGPVKKELRTDLWNRFKTISTAINKRYQEYFERLRASEMVNLQHKELLCEKVEKMNLDNLNSFADWEKKTTEIKDIQREWKMIGFAPKKYNVDLYERFRRACDNFFELRTQRIKEHRAKLSENLAKKRELCRIAEELKESNDWRKATDEFVRIQKEWKNIGPVAKKYSNSIWKEFIAACDYFFERKTKENSSQHEEETKNLQQKKDILTRLEAVYEKAQEEAEAAKEELTTLMDEWRTVGFVPFRDKDKINKKWEKLTSKVMKKLNMDETKHHLEMFSSRMEEAVEDNMNAVYREREKIVRSIDIIKSDIINYENNLGAMNTTTKKGNALMDNIEKKVEKLKEELSMLEVKLRIIDKKL